MILGFMALYYGGDFYKEALESVCPYIDRMHICFSKTPSQGFGSPLSNVDTEYSLRKIAEEVMGDKLIWDSQGGFFTEAEHRAERYRYSVGYSAIISLDADEVMAGIPGALKYVDAHEERFYGIKGYLHFFKSFDWVFQDAQTPIRIEKLTAPNLDTNLNCPMTVYHTSLMQSIELLKLKFDVFGHKNEVRPNYLEHFLSWTPEKIDEITDLHPTRSDIWYKPSKYEGFLPESLKNHKKQEKRRMKILYIPIDYGRHENNPELFTDFLNALNVFVEARVMETYIEIDALVQFKPDVILYQGSLPKAYLNNIKSLTGALLLMYTGDGTIYPPQSFVEMKDIVDGFLVPFSGEKLRQYESLLGKPAFFLWEPIQNWRYVPNKQLKEGNIVFVGNYYEHLPGAVGRDDISYFIDNKVQSLTVRGNMAGRRGDAVPIDYMDVPKLYNEAYAVICENNYYHEDYFTPRNLGAMAAGSCALMRWFPGIEKFFQNYTHCLYYRDKYELLAAIDFIKQNPALRDHIADYGFKLANEKYTAKHWAEQLMQIIKTNFLKHFE